MALEQTVLHFFRFLCILTTRFLPSDMSPGPPCPTLRRRPQDAFHKTIIRTEIKRAIHSPEHEVNFFFEFCSGVELQNN
jgi:hypothetical protein